MPRLALLALFAAIATSSAAADLAAIKKAGELRVLAVDGAPAFVSLGAAGDPGLEREILEGFARLHDVRLRVVEVASWAELIPSLVARKGDVIAGGVTDTPVRRKHIDFTVEVFPTRNVVLTRKPSPVITTLEQLRTVRVGTIKGTNLADHLVAAKMPRANLDDSLPSTGFAEALRSGRVVAVLDGVEDALLLQRADPELQLGMFLGPSESLAFGVSKDAPALRAALDEYVSNLRKTPTWSRLVVKYFGAAAADVLKKARSE